MLRYIVKINKEAQKAEGEIEKIINLKRNLVLNSRAKLETLKYFVV